ncbi:MAG: hypothetical protein GF398_02915 [Chitinivibrionales bacterium]|nr:hypothetical protein [Chitinivibrionales bacterium]
MDPLAGDTATEQRRTFLYDKTECNRRKLVTSTTATQLGARSPIANTDILASPRFSLDGKQMACMMTANNKTTIHVLDINKNSGGWNSVKEAERSGNSWEQNNKRNNIDWPAENWIYYQMPKGSVVWNLNTPCATTHASRFQAMAGTP